MPIDYKDYHPKWSLISRLIRYRRAGNKCEWCGAANSLPHPVTQSLVVLTVAHLDRDRTNNRFSNLAALCQRCHLNHDRCQHIFNRRYGRQTKYLNGKLFLLAVLIFVSHRVTNFKTNELCPTPTPIHGGKTDQNGPKTAPTPSKLAAAAPFSPSGGSKSVFLNSSFFMLQRYKITNRPRNHLKTNNLCCDTDRPRMCFTSQTCHNLSHYVTLCHSGLRHSVTMLNIS